MRSGQLLLWIVRVCYGAIIIGLSMAAFSSVGQAYGNTTQAWAVFFGVLGVGLLIVLGDVWIGNKQITTISALYFGLLLGLLLGYILSMALEPFVFDLAGPPDTPGHENLLRRGLQLVITVACCYVCISTLLQTKDEFRFIIPYVEFSKQIKGARPLVLDTSVIIDGRIADICDTRFIDTKLIVPRFVLQELQSVADSSDKLKRNRGRRGLDMLKRMQNNTKVELQIHEGNLSELRDVQKVDERLVVLAKVLGARVVTNDFNLNKIAQLQADSVAAITSGLRADFSRGDQPIGSLLPAPPHRAAPGPPTSDHERLCRLRRVSDGARIDCPPIGRAPRERYRVGAQTSDRSLDQLPPRRHTRSPQARIDRRIL